MKRISIIIFLILLFYQTIYSQENNLESNLRSILISDLIAEQKKEYFRDYLQPFVTAYGSAIGGACFHRADTKIFPKLDIGVSGTYLEISDDNKLFVFNDSKVPTFFGSNNYSDNTIKGSGMSTVFLPQLQLNLGLSADFELMCRGMKANINKEIGEFSLIGIGIKYGLSDLVSSTQFPLDMSVQAVYHAFSIEKWLEAGNFNMNIQLSKKLITSSLNIYTGIGFESTSMTIKTEEIESANNIGDVSIDGENRFRMNIGLSYTVLLFNIHTDYNIGEYSSFGGGLMIVL